MDFFDDFEYENDKNLLNEIEEKKRKTFRSMLNRKRLSCDDMDEMFLGM